MYNVVITGSTRGIGLAYARKFLELGDKVVISSRSESRLDEVIEFLSQKYPNQVFGTTCNVQEYSSVDELGRFAVDKLGKIDFWINNAGTGTTHFGTFDQLPIESIDPVISTNVKGLLYSIHVALQIMLKQKSGHILNMGGRGTNGEATANQLLYSFSKSGYLQIMKTLKEELKDTGVGIHTISPGMVLTDLLTDRELRKSLVKVYNILCIMPSESADIVVPKVRSLSSGQSGKYIEVLTTWKAAFRFMTAWRYKNKYFNEETLEPQYNSEDILT